MKSPYAYRIGIYEGIEGPEQLLYTRPQVFEDWTLCNETCLAVSKEIQDNGFRLVAWPDPFLARPRPTKDRRPVNVVDGSGEFFAGYIFEVLDGAQYVHWDGKNGPLEVIQEVAAAWGYRWFPVAKA